MNIRPSIIATAEQGFRERWCDFQGGTTTFSPWSPNWKEEELKNRFNQMHLERLSTYFTNPEDCINNRSIGLYKKAYQPPENWNLLRSRCSYPRTFFYNLASTSYNVAIIFIHDKQFLAMEAPTKETQQAFLDLLQTFKVTDLVRLTPTICADRDSCFPYWEGRINIHPRTARPTIELNGRELNYFYTDCWEDDQGIDPNRLIAIVKAVMFDERLDQMIGVHCRAGVGRTGTFLAGYALIRDIDEQITHGVKIEHIQISIDKIVWELSLQRPFMVAHFPQYLTLYKLVNSYIEAVKGTIQTV